MINKVMTYLNNYFYKISSTTGLKVSDNIELTFTNSTSKIAGSFDLTYKVGMYIRVSGSDLNDNIYKITAVGVDEITVDGTLVDETEEAYIYQLTPPQDFIELVTEITTWNTNNASSQGVASESIDDYAISFDNSNGTGWQGAFSNRLATYRKMRW